MPRHRARGTPADQYRMWLAWIASDGERRRRIYAEAPWLDDMKHRPPAVPRKGAVRPLHDRLVQHRAAQRYDDETARILRAMKGLD